MSFILLFVLFGIAFLCFTLALLQSSPKGWEDKNGFHYGTVGENEIKHTQLAKNSSAKYGYKLRQV